MVYFVMSILGIGGGLAILCTVYYRAVQFENFRAWLSTVAVSANETAERLRGIGLSFDELKRSLESAQRWFRYNRNPLFPQKPTPASAVTTGPVLSDHPAEASNEDRSFQR